MDNCQFFDGEKERRKSHTKTRLGPLKTQARRFPAYSVFILITSRSFCIFKINSLMISRWRWKKPTIYFPKYTFYTRVTLKCFTPPPPSQTKTIGLLINVKFNYSKVFILGPNPSLDRLNKDRKEGENSQVLKGASTSPLHHHQLLFESKLPFPMCFLAILIGGKNSRGIDD